MQFLRRFGGPITATIVLIFLSVIAVVSIGEGFKVFLIWRDGVKVKKRDGSTINFSLPWRPALAPSKPGSKDLSSDMDSLVGDIANVASAILGGGSKIASSVASEGSGLVPTPLTTVSSVLDGGTASASSVLQNVSGQIEQATSIVAGVVGDATSIVGSFLAAATSRSISGVLPKANSTSPVPEIPFSSAPIPVVSTMSESQEFLPQATHCNTCNSSYSTSSHNMTGVPSQSSSQAIASATTGISRTSTTTSCPVPTTETCTVTETWHSTHYAETATYYTFIANYTVTCTETVSVYPTSNVYLPPANATRSPLPALIACANGMLAKSQKDCPPMLNASYSLNGTTLATYPASFPTSTHPCPNSGYSCSECPDGWFCPPPQIPAQDCICGYGWACTSCKDGYFCIPNPTRGGNGPLNSVASLLATTSASSSITPTMDSFTASPPSLSTFLPLGSVVPVTTGTVTCADGSVVMMIKDCLNGVIGGTSTDTTNTLELSIINMAKNAVSGTLTGISNLAGGLPTSGNNQVASSFKEVQPSINSPPVGLLSSVTTGVASASATFNRQRRQAF